MTLKDHRENRSTNNLSSPLGGQGAAIDHILTRTAEYKNRRIALVCNNASVTSGGVATRLALIQNGFTLVKLFSPEHGLNAAGEDGKYQEDGTDHLTGLPITSLYGDRLAPMEQDLAGVDAVLFDIPDVGCRFYTYLWTMTHVMEACAAFNLPLIIADRPNPIGTDLSMAEGPMLDEAACSSFIGRWSIPTRHCCTLGELAGYFKAVKMPTLQLEIIPFSNLQRGPTSDYIFTPTSPAIQNKDTALLYPGMGLLEGINVNEGRGTGIPFKICGAPWIDQHKLQQAFTETSNPGIISYPISYTPTTGLYAGETCNGLQFFVEDEIIFRPVQTGIKLISSIMQLYPTNIAERLYRTLANPGGNGHLDKLLGIPGAFIKIKNGEKIMTDVANDWAAIMKDHLLYK